MCVTAQLLHISAREQLQNPRAATGAVGYTAQLGEILAMAHVPSRETDWALEKKLKPNQTHSKPVILWAFCM